MRYTLTWMPILQLFSLHYPNADHRTFTEDAMRAQCNGNATLLAWVAFAREHPNVDVDYEMLPPCEPRWNENDDNGASSYGDGVPGQNLSCFV